MIHMKKHLSIARRFVFGIFIALILFVYPFYKGVIVEANEIYLPKTIGNWY